MNLFQAFVGFLGRALLSLIFITSALFKIFDWQETLQLFTHTLTDWLTLSVSNDRLQTFIEWGLVNDSSLLTVAIGFELLGGLMVFLGVWPRLGAVLLLLFLVPVTVVFHHFWEIPEGPERLLQMTMFMKNLSIAGGLLLVLAYGNKGKLEHLHGQSDKVG